MQCAGLAMVNLGSMPYTYVANCLLIVRSFSSVVLLCMHTCTSITGIETCFPCSWQENQAVLYICIISCENLAGIFQYLIFYSSYIMLYKILITYVYPYVL